MTNTKSNQIQEYCGYFPARIMQELSSVSTIKILFYIFTRCAMNRNVNPIKISHKNVKGLCKKSFYSGIKELENALWISVDRTDCHEYLVAIHPNYMYKTHELEFLKGNRSKNGQ